MVLLVAHATITEQIVFYVAVQQETSYLQKRIILQDKIVGKLRSCLKTFYLSGENSYRLPLSSDDAYSSSQVIDDG